MYIYVYTYIHICIHICIYEFEFGNLTGTSNNVKQLEIDCIYIDTITYAMSGQQNRLHLDVSFLKLPNLLDVLRT